MCRAFEERKQNNYTRNLPSFFFFIDNASTPNPSLSFPFFFLQTSFKMEQYGNTTTYNVELVLHRNILSSEYWRKTASKLATVEVRERD